LTLRSAEPRAKDNSQATSVEGFNRTVHFTYAKN
jgi:hypothetical protein